MIDLTSDLEKLATFPSDERTRALERIIPRKAIREVLQETGPPEARPARRWFDRKGW